MNQHSSFYCINSIITKTMNTQWATPITSTPTKFIHTTKSSILSTTRNTLRGKNLWMLYKHIDTYIRCHIHRRTSHDYTRFALWQRRQIHRWEIGVHYPKALHLVVQNPMGMRSTLSTTPQHLPMYNKCILRRWWSRIEQKDGISQTSVHVCH